MLKSEDIAKAHQPRACSFYAVINLFKLRGLEPPSYARLSALFRAHVADEGRMTSRPYIGEGYGLLPTDELALLAGAGFPGFVAVGVLPDETPEPHEILLPLLASGCHLILGYRFRHPSGRYLDHSAVCEGFDSRGYKLINSDPSHAEGEVIDLAPTPTPDEWQAVLSRYETATHGVRCVLPYVGVETAERRVGLHSFFLLAYPNYNATSAARAGLGVLAAFAGSARAAVRETLKARRRWPWRVRAPRIGEDAPASD